MKTLIFPLFQIPTGHHQVAYSVKDRLEQRYPMSDIKVMDFLSYCNQPLEKTISTFYIKWIKTFPNIYRNFYRQFMYASENRYTRAISHSKPFTVFFEEKMVQLLNEEKPELIVCTHSFPSRILGRLKKQGKINIPVVNVYTDFFMNGVWAKEEIDFHFVPHQQAKDELISKYKIKKESIFVTGIPIDRVFEPRKQEIRADKTFSLLVAGGNSGLGNILDLVNQSVSSKIKYIVLCGKNQQLYHKLSQLNKEQIVPVPYISSREQMNELYNQVDGVITKPGGVSISELITKRIPIFVLSYLPGQEEFNKDYLTEHGLIYSFDANQFSEKQLLKILTDEVESLRYQKRVNHYLAQFEYSVQDAIDTLTDRLQQEKEPREVVHPSFIYRFRKQNRHWLFQLFGNETHKQ